VVPGPESNGALKPAWVLDFVIFLLAGANKNTNKIKSVPKFKAD
jgi:hypothetical protein